MVAATLCGCTTAPSPRPTLGQAAPRQTPSAPSTVSAVSQAEQAVAVAPQDAGARYRLGRAYLSVGRFASAGSAFTDTLSLDPTQGQAGVMAALAMLQQGRDQDARSLLARVRTCAPSADLGLALALAGQIDEAQSVLETAARQAGADARTRLNLAFVYALQGRWNDAVVTAAQDISADQLPGRLHRWAQIAQITPRSADRVTAMLGIIPQFDPGQPIALALAPLPSTASAPLAHAIITVPAAAAQTIPVVAMAAAEVPARSLPAKAVGQRPRAVTGLPKARIGGHYVVQLGVYYSARQVQAAWSRLGGGNGYLAAFVPAESNVPSMRANATLHRLSVGGFATQRNAMRLCRLIKSRGGDCFVRGSSGDRPLEWASRGGERNPAA
jgi:hypothetical protein